MAAADPDRERIPPSLFLSVFVGVLFVVPAYFVLPGTGAAGSPPIVLGLIALMWWLVSRFVFVEPGPNRRNPVRLALLLYLWVVVLCWTLGKTWVLSALEGTQSDRALIVMFGLAGIALLAMDGIRTLGQLTRIATAIAWGGAFMAVIGVIQFILHVDLARWLTVPGVLQNISEDAVLDSRSGFTRARGTALHPIEFGVVAAAAIPIAYWSKQRSQGRLAVLPLGLLTFASMIALSRSAVLALVIVGLVMIVDASWRDRANLIGGGLLMVLAAGLFVNGLVGTLRSLFTQAGNDPSVTARIGRFPKVMALVAEHPWFGRGFGTYNIQEYFLLDNEIQKSLIEMGLLGVAALVVFIFFVVTMAWRTRQGATAEQRLPAVALTACILGLFISSYTFDAFFYRILTGLLYLCIGMVGALWRIRADERESRSPLAEVRFIDFERGSSAPASVTGPPASHTATPIHSERRSHVHRRAELARRPS